MDIANALIICSLENNVVVSKVEIPFEVTYNFDWVSVDDLKKCFSLNCENLKYFDEEGDLISLINNEDLTVFKELMLCKKLPKDELVLIAYRGQFDLSRFRSLENILELHIDNEYPNSFVQVTSDYSVPNCNALLNMVDYLSSSSSSSSVSPTMGRNTEKDGLYKSKSVARYAAKMKKELNYLPGSEISDGQTISKKWCIKNIGSKKWKANAVKGVLLPSKYSNWISHSPIRVPICLADRTVDIELDITINGLWNTDESSFDDGSRDIHLTWLLFKDSLVTKHEDNFKDYILTQLELSIIVKKRSNNTDKQISAPNKKYERQQTENSIEIIDQDLAIVDVLKGDRDNNYKHMGYVAAPNNKGTRIDSIELDLELPDCPQFDDFQISDFISPQSFLPLTPREINKPRDDDQSIMSLLQQSNYVGRYTSTREEDSDVKQIMEDAIKEGLLQMKARLESKVRLSTNVVESVTHSRTDDSINWKNVNEKENILCSIDNPSEHSNNNDDLPEEIKDNKEYILTVVDELKRWTNNVQDISVGSATDDVFVSTSIDRKMSLKTGDDSFRKSVLDDRIGAEPISEERNFEEKVRKDRLSTTADNITQESNDPHSDNITVYSIEPSAPSAPILTGSTDEYNNTTSSAQFVPAPPYSYQNYVAGVGAGWGYTAGTPRFQQPHQTYNYQTGDVRNYQAGVTYNYQPLPINPNINTVFGSQAPLWQGNNVNYPYHHVNGANHQPYVAGTKPADTKHIGFR